MINYTSLSGSVHLSAIGGFRVASCTTKPGSYERICAGLPLIAELEEVLDDLVQSVSLNNVLMLVRIRNPCVPSSDRFRIVYRLFRDRLHGDPLFARTVIDNLAIVISRCVDDAIGDVISDDEFLNLFLSCSG